MMEEHGDAEWQRYNDLADDIAIPTIGVCVLAYVNSDGRRATAYCVDSDDEQAYLLIGILEQVKRELLDLIRHDDEGDL